MSLRIISCTLFFAILSALAQMSLAQTPSTPAQPITIIVPYPSGALSDTMARLISQRLAQVLKQAVVVINKAGAGGTLGMDALAKSAPNGLTLAFSAISPLTLSPHLMKVPYDARQDVLPVASVMFSPVYLLATSKFAGRTLEDALRMGTVMPGSVSVATPGPGSVGHIMLAQMQQKKETLTHVPYPGSGGQALTDALGGQFDLMLMNPTANLQGLLGQGKLRVLAVGAPQRLATLPEVKTLAELGHPKANMASVYGFFAPAKTPPDVVHTLNLAINQVIKQADMQKQIADAQGTVLLGTSAFFADSIDKEFTANGKVVKEANIKAD